MFSGGWFWVVVDGVGCMQMGLGRFRWFSVICSFSGYGEIFCFRFKRSRILWEIFVVSSNNDAKVSLKQMSKFLGSSTYKVSLSKDLGQVREVFVWWKLTYIALSKFSLFWLRLSPFWGNFFKDLLSWLICWQDCILGWLSDKYFYLLKLCCHYIFQV